MHYETERPVYDPRYARLLEENQNIFVEILGTLNRIPPEPLLRRARESVRARAKAGKLPFPTFDHWGDLAFQALARLILALDWRCLVWYKTSPIHKQVKAQALVPGMVRSAMHLKLRNGACSAEIPPRS